MRTILAGLALSAAVCLAGYQSAYSGYFALTKAVAIERTVVWKPLAFSVRSLSNTAVFYIASERPVTTGIDIYSVSGKKLKGLTLSTGSNGRTNWDLKDSRGRLVAPGVYIARLNNKTFPLSRIFAVWR